MDGPTNPVREFLRVQATEIHASFKSPDEFHLAFGDFLEDLAVEIGDMLGTVTAKPVTAFGMFIGMLAAAHANAMEDRWYDGSEPDDAEAPESAAAG